MRQVGPLDPGQPRAALIAEVVDALGHVHEGEPVVVACSGGPDSTVLAYLAAEARPDLDLSIAHVRHGLRDDTVDVEIVHQHADWLGLPIDVREVTVEADGHGVEAAARQARYAALRRIAAKRGAVAILVAHTADDQAETVLLRIARGTGIDGLSAMRTVTDDIVRPLLRVRRVDIQRFLLLEGLPTAEDPTNMDPAVRRSVVRHELLALLERVAPDPVGALCRLADLARDEREALDDLVADPLASARRIGPVRAVADRTLSPLVPAVARRVVRALIAEITDAPLDADAVTRVLEHREASALTLPGPLEVTTAGGWRAFAPQSLPRSRPVPLSVPGVAVWQPAGIAVQAITPETDPWRERATEGGPGQVALAFTDAWSPPPATSDVSIVPPGGTPERMVIALPADVGGLTVRHRESGDRVVTAAGTRRLQDVMVDAGVPRAVRDVWPVVVTDSQRVAWVPGLAADEQLLRAGRAAPGGQLRISRAN